MIVKNVEKKENNTALFQVEVDAESFEKAINAAYKKLKGNIYVAGFRKGKAPRVVIEGMYGSDVFHDEAVQTLAPEAFEFAVEQEKLDTVGVPSIADYTLTTRRSSPSPSTPSSTRSSLSASIRASRAFTPRLRSRMRRSRRSSPTCASVTPASLTSIAPCSRVTP